MGGTYYRSPAPGEPPFIREGDKVKKGQTICIIEAMKLMNEIEVRLPCVRICLKSQVLFAIEHSRVNEHHERPAHL